MAVATGTIPAALVRSRTDRRRAIVDRLFRGLCLVAAVLCVIPLFLIVAYVVVNGIQALNLDLLTKPPRALGVGGGAAAAILGTIQLVGLASLIAIPAGILAAVYVNEFSHRRSATAIRFAADVLVGIPSILMGIFVFTFLVLPFKQYNAFAGAVALALLMVPVIMRTTEEMLRLVPGDLREASFALGVPTWRTVMSVVIRTGLPGILTGVMLAVARAAGETAPLLFTALGSRLINVGNWTKPMDALPLFVYTNARQPIDALNQQAWGAALLLLAFVLTINILVRARSLSKRGR
ncbi:MAG TPA: phosphate ABC transporter permease PstA [Patescibacteria group bacterium]|nr:phosphate ABC transporter permease PstA [Patescibacteria group bacterium]